MKLVDSSCLICLFDEINKPLILLDWKKTGHQIVITNQVNDEIKCGDAYKFISPEIKNGNIEVKNLVSQEEVDSFRFRHIKLGKGESSIILAAIKYNKEQKKYYAVLDDNAARKVAKELGVNLTGTYGLLLKLKERNCISEGTYKECLTKLEASKFRLNLEKLK